MKELNIIDGLKRKEKVVFDYVFNYFYSSLCAFCRQYIDDRNSVEDLVQDFFVDLWVEGPRLQIKSSLKSYLFAAIRNRCLDYQKHHRVIEKHRTYILFSTQEEDYSTDHYFALEAPLEAFNKNVVKNIPKEAIWEFNCLSNIWRTLRCSFEPGFRLHILSGRAEIQWVE